MSYKIEHSFFIPQWHFDLAKYHFAHRAKIKGFRQGVVDKNLLTIIDIRYKDFVFNETIEESIKGELNKINSKNFVISHSRGELKESDKHDGWYINLIVELQNPPLENEEIN